MKIQILSDIHLEFLKKIPKIPVLGDYLVLAGDIGYAGSPNLYKFLRECRQKYKHIYYVAGNHEFYGGTYSDRLNILRRESGDSLTFLEKDVVDIEGTSLRIIGTTLWTEIPPEETYVVSQMMADYKKIIHLARPLKVEDTNYFHRTSRYFLRESLSDCEAEGKDAIVITHHLPSFQMIANEYKKCNNYGFASDCEDLIRAPVKLWVCGHSHIQAARDINGVPVVIGSIGYPSELRDKGVPSLCYVDIDDQGVVEVNWWRE